jgi:long-chain acyl-CoA synthetase
MTNLANGLVDAARALDGRLALRLGDTRVSFAEFDDASARVAAMLRDRGLQPGDRVGIMLPNVLAFPPIYYGVLRAGGVVVPMNPLLKSREIAFYVGDSGARWIFAFAGVADEASKGAADASAECVVSRPGRVRADPRGRDAGHSADRARARGHGCHPLHVGTTGQPKGAELTHASLSKNAEVSTRLFSLTSDDVIFGGLPMFHSFGQTCALNAAVQTGACVTLLPRFDPTSALETLQRDRVTIFEGVPTMYAALLQYPQHADYDNIRTATMRVRRCGHAGGDPSRLRENLRLHHPRGLRPVGDLAGRVVQPPRPRTQARLNRHADRGSGFPARRRRFRRRA